jgi:hypothetical protein
VVRSKHKTWFSSKYDLFEGSSLFLFLIFLWSVGEAQGQDARMTVVGTACLDNSGLKTYQELRVQKKGALIVEKVMMDIIQVNDGVVFLRVVRGILPVMNISPTSVCFF